MTKELEALGFVLEVLRRSEHPDQSKLDKHLNIILQALEKPEESPTTLLVKLEKTLESRVKEDYRLADIWFKKNESVAKMILRENEVIKYILMLINHLKEDL